MAEGEGGKAPEGAGQGQQTPPAGQQQNSPAGAGGQQQAPPSMSDKARENFAVLEKKAKDLEDRLSQSDAKWEKLKGFFTGDGSAGPDAGADEAFYASPSKAVREEVQRAEQNIISNVERREVLRELRSSDGFTAEIEQAMTKVIQDNDLARLGAEKAVRLSYKYVTGRELGEPGGGNSYTTQQTKERLARPGSGGAAGQRSPKQLLAAGLDEWGGEKRKEMHQNYLDAMMNGGQ